MVIAPSEGASTDEYLAVMFAETYSSVEGLDEAKGNMNEIKTCVAATE